MTNHAAVLCGLGTWLPPRVVTNDELAERFGMSDEWIRSRTGIRQRHVADPATPTSHLAVEAGSRALKSAGVDTVDAVVLATTTPDRRCPATAPLVAARLGLGAALAFDITAVCTGFVYGLAIGAGLVTAGVAEQILVIGADTFSTILDPADHAAMAIFGDGGGAVVLRAGSPEEDGALGPFDLGSDGTGEELIMIRTGGSHEPFHTVAAEAADPYFRMNGRAVFFNAVEKMADSARTVLARTGWPGGQPDVVVAHQANLRIVHALADRLGVARELCVVNVDRVGNTVAASVPLALADGVASGAVRPGDRVLMTAFGGGLAWGSCAVRWPSLAPLETKPDKTVTTTVQGALR